MFTDSHCHLTYPGLVENWPAVFAAMREAQVDRALCICTTMEEFEQVHSLAMAQDFVWASVGVHPDTEHMADPDARGIEQTHDLLGARAGGSDEPNGARRHDIGEPQRDAADHGSPAVRTHDEHPARCRRRAAAATTP